MEFKSTEFLKELATDLAVESGIDLTDSELTVRTSVKNGFVFNEGKLVSNDGTLQASVMINVNTRNIHHIDTIQCQLNLDTDCENTEKAKKSKLLIVLLCKLYCLPYEYTIKF